MFREVRYAVRALWLNKGFAAVAILCLSFGIGLNTTIFSAVDGVLIQSLPYHDAGRLVILNTTNRKSGVSKNSVSYRDFIDWKAQNSSFSALSASAYRNLTISDGTGEPERFSGSEISWDLFPMLGIQPELGRAFTAADDQPGAEAVALISHTVWMRRYQGDPAAVGRRILINARPYQIVGVMPANFEFPQNQKLWVPIVPRVFQADRNVRDLVLFGRLKPGSTVELAQQDLSTVARQLAAQYPDSNENWDALVRPLKAQFIPRDVEQVILLMMGGVTLVLLIACSNVANLQLARASVRQREISIRSALGAGRGQIVRQLLIESVTLGLVSVPLGLVIAYVGDRLISSLVPPDTMPYYIHWAIDWRSASYSVAVAVGTALLFGLVPALQATRGNLQDSLKEGSRGNTGSRGWARNILIGAEVALSLVALVGALLFVRTFVNLDTKDIGFDPKPLMTMRFYMPGEAYDAPDSKLRRVQDIVERVEGLPGVDTAFSSNLVPISGGGGGGNVVIEGRPAEKGREAEIRFTGVTPHFYRALGLKLISGSDFTDLQGWSRMPVAIINQTMAERFWKDQNPIGARFRLADTAAADDWFTVIGVGPDVHHDDVGSSNPKFAGAYVPYAYQQSVNTGLVIRTAGNPAQIAPAVRAVIRAADPNLPVFNVNTMDTVRAKSFWQYGLFGWVFSTIGIVGLLLAAVGVYGVLSYSVAQRAQEIGVRMALGAGQRDVLKLVVGQGVRLALYGVAAGVAIAAVAMPAARSLLYDVSPLDPISFSVVSIFLVGVAALASYAPARRAMKVNPTTALRGE